MEFRFPELIYSRFFEPVPLTQTKRPLLSSLVDFYEVADFSNQFLFSSVVREINMKLKQLLLFAAVVGRISNLNNGLHLARKYARIFVRLISIREKRTR